MLPLVGKSRSTHGNLATVIVYLGKWAREAVVGRRVPLDCTMFCTLWILYHACVFITQK